MVEGKAAQTEDSDWSLHWNRGQSITELGSMREWNRMHDFRNGSIFSSIALYWNQKAIARYSKFQIKKINSFYTMLSFQLTIDNKDNKKFIENASQSIQKKRLKRDDFI